MSSPEVRHLSGTAPAWADASQPEVLCDVSPAVADADLPLVLLHGWAADSSHWQSLIDTLSSRHRVLAVDLPGFGTSSPSSWQERDVLEVIGRQLPERCVLVGWSLGGMLAMLLAAREPGRVAGLVTIASNVCYVAQKGWSSAMSRDVFRDFSAAFSVDPAACLQRFAKLQAHGDSAARSLIRDLRSRQHTPDDEQLISWRASLGLLETLDTRRALEKITQPSLHLFGDHDALVPADAANHWPAGRQREVVVLEACGHVPHLSRPVETARLLEGFLDRYGLRRRARAVRDKKAVASSFSRAAARYDAAAHLQRGIGERLLGRLLACGSGAERERGPGLDLGCGTGYFLPWLQQAYPAVEWIACDLAEGMVRHARGQRDNRYWLCADAEQLPLADGVVDTIFSNLVLQWCEHWPRLAGELYRVLAPGGVLAFSTLGPATLGELRDAWRAVDSAVHVNEFIDHETIERALAGVGFTTQPPTMAIERVWYSELATLLHELKALGARNVNRGRRSELTGPARIRALERAYDCHRQQEGLPATWEVYYFVVRKS